MDEKKKKILALLKTRTLGVVSTIDSKNNKPESALIAFSETDDLELIFGTSSDSRKFTNIQINPRVAFAVNQDKTTVQYEGVAKVTDGEEAKQCQTVHFAKNASSVKYAQDEKQRYIKISPDWIRYSNHSSSPKDIFEINFGPKP